jgi:hypothetical protein
MNVKKIFVFV